MNLVEELRARAFQGRFNTEAADEIERLQAELAECRKVVAKCEMTLLAMSPRNSLEGVIRKDALDAIEALEQSK